MGYTLDEYREAAVRLWGDAGALAVDTFARLNTTYFGDRLPPVPIVIGLTAYGKCLGFTRHEPKGLPLPRISLASPKFDNVRVVEDTILHEMVHVELHLAGLYPKHNGLPWCQRIEELSPAVLGHGVRAVPVKVQRVEGGRLARRPLDGHLSRKVIGTWPHSVRPHGYYDGAPGIDVDTY